MFLKTIIFVIALTGCVLSAYSASISGDPACFTKRTPEIPSCHIYHTKRKPLTIGHRGNPRKYQENSFEGFRSLRRLRADGFEVDVFLTKDKKLVCFHDDNALSLTGVNRSISDMTSAEIKKLRYKKTLVYGTQSYSFRRKLKLVFLDKLLCWAKRTDLLVYIEMKPSDPVLKSAAAIQNSIETGKAVAAMVKKFKMVDQVIVNGYDLLKTITAKQAYKDLVIGTAYPALYWYTPTSVYQVLKYQLLQQFPSIAACLNPIPTTSSAFVSYIYTSGVLEKAMGAAYMDLELVMYNNPLFGTSNTLATIKANYSTKIVVGAYTPYSVSKDSSSIAAEQPIVNSMVKEGVHFFVTDDVRKMRQTIKRNKPRYNHHPYGDEEEGREDEGPPTGDEGEEDPYQDDQEDFEEANQPFEDENEALGQDENNAMEDENEPFEDENEVEEHY